MSIGSVFLGDAKTRFRGLGSPTPPSSPGAPPPPSSAGTHSLGSAFADLDDVDREDVFTKPSLALTETQDRVNINPEISLELRIRWLEALLIGSRKGKEADRGMRGLAKHTQALQASLDGAVQENEGLRRFMNRYDQYASLLTLPLTKDGPDRMNDEEIVALLGEMEQDVRHAGRDMHEIKRLEESGVLGAGRLNDHHALDARLQALLKANAESQALLSTLAESITNLIDRHATSTDALSELFVEWDEVLSDSENRVGLIERETAERHRLGIH